MSPSALSTAFLAVAAASVVLAQPDPADPTPLVDKHYAYPSGIVRHHPIHSLTPINFITIRTKSIIILLPSVALK